MNWKHILVSFAVTVVFLAIIFRVKFLRTLVLGSTSTTS